MQQHVQTLSKINYTLLTPPSRRAARGDRQWPAPPTAALIRAASRSATRRTQRPVTVTGKISHANADAIIGTDAFAWTVNNLGTIENTGTTGSGIQLLAGGTVTNENAGSVSPGGSSGFSLIEGYNDGVLIEFAPGTVSNLGQIEGTGTAGIGVNIFSAGGQVTNGSAAVTTALISGGSTAVVITGGAGTVANFGTVTSTSSRLRRRPSRRWQHQQWQQYLDRRVDQFGGRPHRRLRQWRRRDGHQFRGDQRR